MWRNDHARGQALESKRRQGPTTATGRSRLARVPSPTWPKALSPQQYALFPVVTPQLCPETLNPASLSNLRPPDTMCGVAWNFLGPNVPSPSWPSLLLPQQ